MAKTIVSFVVPCFNEGNRIVPVLKSIKKFSLSKEIIVVDDGSNQKTTDILATIKGIKLITHPKNLGKSQALKTGLLASRSDIVAFVDADLVNLKPSHLLSLTKPIIDNQYDMVISDRQGETIHSRLSGFSIACTGERAFRKKLLLNHIKVFNNYGYLIEAAINQIVFDKYRVAKTIFTGVCQSPKFKKNGFLIGWYQDFKMLFDIFKYLGSKQFFYQLNFVKNIPSI